MLKSLLDFDTVIEGNAKCFSFLDILFTRRKDGQDFIPYFIIKSSKFRRKSKVSNLLRICPNETFL